MLTTTSAPALNLFRRAEPPIAGTRGARVTNTNFALMNGRLYVIEHDRPRCVTRRPHLSKIAGFENQLVGLSYQGDLLTWTAGSGHDWTPADPVLITERVTDFAAGPGALVAVGASGRAYVIDRDRRVTDLDVGGAGAVAGRRDQRGFVLTKLDQSQLQLDVCGALLGEVRR